MCIHWELFAPAGLDSKMSSATLSLQQLYEDEKVRSETLARKLARSEAKFEREKARLGAEFEHDKARLEAELKHDKARLEAELKREKELGEAKDEQLDGLEASFEITKGKLEAHIEHLQTALDDADRPRSLGDDKNIEELQAKNRSLEGQLDDARQVIHETSQLNGSLKKSLADSCLKLKESRKDLKTSKTEVLMLQGEN